MPKAGRNPLLYEINTRCWLRELSERLGHRVALSDVPDEEVARFRRLGFTHIWLMGVWKVGPRSRAHSLDHFKLHAEELHCGESQIHGSTFAIAGYDVDHSIGGEEGLRKFREQLHSHDLKLLLDFIPNHLGLDHPWLVEKPQLFIQSSRRVPGTFAQRWETGKVFIAHGKDPYFPPWTDTAQLDYRNPETQRHMEKELLSVAARCDGVRCDMAMLVLNEVFARNWAGFQNAFPPIELEFWASVIAATRKAHPGFLFLAEAYWDLEARLQELGFDYTYVKTFYDHLMARRFGELQNFLRQSKSFLARGTFFLENHDEPRVAQRLPWPEHQAAALLLLSMPGSRLLHDGQLEGLAKRVSVHFSARPAEKQQPDIELFYVHLLTVIQETAIGKGEWTILDPLPVHPGAALPQGLLIMRWQSQAASFDLVVVNLSIETIHCRVRLNVLGIQQKSWIWRSLFDASPGPNPQHQAKDGELSLLVQPYHAQVLAFQQPA